MAKEKERTLQQMKRTAETAKTDKETISDTLDTYERTKVRTITNMDWIFIILSVVVMALGLLERNKIIMLIGGFGFIIMLIKSAIAYMVK